MITLPAVMAAAALSAPPTLAVQGRLSNGGGAVDGTYTLTLSIWSDATGGVQLHQEVFVAQPVVDGVFSLALGTKAPLDPLAFGGDIWVGVQVEGEPELPRERVHPVSRAYWADFALIAEGLQCTGCITESMLGFALPAPITSIDGLGGGTLTGAVDLAGFETTGLRVDNAAAPPVTCGPAQAGSVYFDSVKRAFRGCDGSAWILLGAAAPLGSVDNPAATCAAILTAAPDTPDGQYYLVGVDGVVRAARCDMKGGGWTEILSWNRETEGQDLTALGQVFTTEINNMTRYELQPTYLRFADSNSDADVLALLRTIPFQNSGTWKLDLHAEHTSFDDSGAWYYFTSDTGVNALAACTDAKTVPTGYSAEEQTYFVSGCPDSGGYDYNRTYNAVFAGQLPSRVASFRLRTMMYDSDGDESRLYRLRVWVK